MQDDGERDQYILRAQPVVRGTQQLEMAIKQNKYIAVPRVMSNKLTAAALALFAGALMVTDYPMLARAAGAEALAGDDFQVVGSGSAACSPRGAGTNDWLVLHRPDGEIVYLRTDQIVFVTSAVAGAANRAHSKVQLLNGFADVRESVEEVMRAIQTDASKQISTR
jgi:hypothetical protein